MARADSTFPLSFHKGSGNYCKTVKGHRYYFGRDKQAALEKWYKQKDDLLAGKKPRDQEQIVTVQYMCNFVLERKKEKVDTGDLSIRHFNDLKFIAKFLVEHFGRNRSVGSIGPDDFGQLRRKMFDRWAPSGLVARITNVRSFFNAAYKANLLKEQVRFGESLSLPSKRRQRIARNASHAKFFEANEIQTLLDAATPHMRAFILLGVNAGLGNADIAEMEAEHIDLNSGWLDYPRGKTAVRRRAKMWPETIDAVCTAIKQQPPTSRLDHLVFVTRFRSPWSNPVGSDCVLSKQFTKLCRSVDLYRKGRGFYAMRHVTETIGGDARDQVALDYIMGHFDGSIASQYRERVDDGRLEAVTNTIHAWLFQGKHH